MFLDHKEIIKLENSKTINIKFTTLDWYAIQNALEYYEKKSKTSKNTEFLPNIFDYGNFNFEKTLKKIDKILDSKWNDKVNLKWDMKD